jgi:hypothetical protein
MRKFILSLAAVAAISVTAVFASTAEAHGPHCRTYNNYGYGYRYGSLPGISGYTPYSIYSQPVIPYGAGYSGGWQPYQGMYYRPQPRVGVYLGF